MHQKILLVEDDETLGFLLKEFLSNHQMDVDWAKNGVEGLRMFSEKQYDLCLLDVMMPALDGFTVAEIFRSRQRGLPIIFLTAKSQHSDVRKGFLAGADDYIKKPVDEDELLARIHAVLKRADKEVGEEQNQHAVFELGRFIFDSQQMLLLDGSNKQALTDMESQLLKLLCQHKGQLVQREWVLQKIWGRSDFLARKSMDVFISRLRKYFSADPNVQITNVHSSGFVLEVSVHNNFDQ